MDVALKREVGGLTKRGVGEVRTRVSGPVVWSPVKVVKAMKGKPMKARSTGAQGTAV
jgi:hypothetical protein